MHAQCSSCLCGAADQLSAYKTLMYCLCSTHMVGDTMPLWDLWEPVSQFYYCKAPTHVLGSAPTAVLQQLVQHRWHVHHPNASASLALMEASGPR